MANEYRKDLTPAKLRMLIKIAHDGIMSNGNEVHISKIIYGGTVEKQVRQRQYLSELVQDKYITPYENDGFGIARKGIDMLDDFWKMMSALYSSESVRTALKEAENAVP